MADRCPDGWTHDTVRGLTTKHFSGPSPTCEERPIRNAQEWGLLKTTAITWDGWDQNAHKVPPALYWGNRNLEVRSGDVLITKAGPRHRVGVVVHVPSTQPHLMVSGKMVGLQPDTDKVIPSVLAGLLSTPSAQKYLDQRTTGMAESQVNFANSTLLSTPLCVPSVPEQRRIAEILDTLDEAIRRTEQIIAKLEQIKQGLLNDLLTRGIDENGDLRDPERHPEQFKDSMVGRLPREWDVRHLERATLASAPICYGIVQAGPFVDGGPQVLTIADLAGDFRTGLHRTSPHIERRYARSRVEPNDVLLSIKGTIGRMAVVPPWYRGNISRDLARLRFPRSVSPSYVRHYLQSPAGQRRLELSVVGTTRAEISIYVLKRFSLPLAPQQEQEEIARQLDTAEWRVRVEETEAAKLRLLRQGLMEDLLTGRVRVTNLEASA